MTIIPAYIDLYLNVEHTLCSTRTLGFHTHIDSRYQFPPFCIRRSVLRTQLQCDTMAGVLKNT